MRLKIQLSPYTHDVPEPIASLEPTTELVVYVDGSCQPNPGNMFVGVAIYHKEEMLWHDTVFVGSGTNNLAEYHAFIHAARALLAVHKQFPEYRLPATIVSDSRLAVDAFVGLTTPSNPSFGVLFNRYTQLCGRLTRQPAILWVPRSKNRHADKLSKVLQPSTVTRLALEAESNGGKPLTDNTAE